MKEFKKALPLTFPVMAGYIFLGSTYGILMVTNGFPIWLPVLTAALIYTGSMEFLMAEILTSSFNPAAAFLTAFMVGARHLFYGLSMLKKYRGCGPAKLYLIYTTSDETFAINYNADISNFDKTRFYTAVSLLDQLYWIVGTLIGSLFGSLISFNTKGLDFVMTAMFISILSDQWMRDSCHLPEIIGLLSSLLCLLLFGAEHFLIPSMILILILLILNRSYIEGKNHDKE
jgi:4-azaleucine resistance transporter AzlC